MGNEPLEFAKYAHVDELFVSNSSEAETSLRVPNCYFASYVTWMRHSITRLKTTDPEVCRKMRLPGRLCGNIRLKREPTHPLCLLIRPRALSRPEAVMGPRWRIVAMSKKLNDRSAVFGPVGTQAYQRQATTQQLRISR